MNPSKVLAVGAGLCLAIIVVVGPFASRTSTKIRELHSKIDASWNPFAREAMRKQQRLLASRLQTQAVVGSWALALGLLSGFASWGTKVRHNSNLVDDIIEAARRL